MFTYLSVCAQKASLEGQEGDRPVLSGEGDSAQERRSLAVSCLLIRFFLPLAVSFTMPRHHRSTESSYLSKRTENMCPSKNLCTGVHNSVSHYLVKHQTKYGKPQKPISWWTDKDSVSFPWNGLFLCHKKRWSIDTSSAWVSLGNICRVEEVRHETNP